MNAQMNPSSESPLRTSELQRPLVNTIQTVRSPIWSVPSLSEGQLSVGPVDDLPAVGQMVTVGGEQHVSPQIPLIQQTTPRMVLAKPLIHSHPPRPIKPSSPNMPSLAQLASQLPKLTPQMILAGIKNLQAQQQAHQQAHKAVSLQQAAQVVSIGDLDSSSSNINHPGRALMPKAMRHAHISHVPLSSVGPEHVMTPQSVMSQKVVAPLAIPPRISSPPQSSVNISMAQKTTITTNKPRKPCNCKNSQCLKLYCDCFANGEFCRESCNCHNCKNNIDYGEDRAKAIKVCLDRNPNAFKPKVGQNRTGDERRHIKGCNCKRSWCLKNYCECYEAKIPCSANCRCVGCKNVADRVDSKTLMHLADAADLRTHQQTLNSHFMDQLEMTAAIKPQTMTLDGQRLPFSFVNEEVARATCLCLLEEASHAAMNGKSYAESERDVLLEFGRCLSQIIRSTQTANDDDRTMVAY